MLVGRLLKSNKGTVIVEVAIMFILVTMMAVGYIYFTQAMRINTVAKIAAREGARVYSITNNPARAKERVKSELALGGINPDENTIDIQTKIEGDKRIVNVKIKQSFYAPFAGEYNLNLRGGAEYILENNPEF